MSSTLFGKKRINLNFLLYFFLLILIFKIFLLNIHLTI